ncbi:hypothetical protein [Fodinibius roseus]|uniref:hypothetical protein n=1 Tax=Fodinibius roseus TaxID=1194090 RepID=UPI0011147CDB|nr:hypothetical protein [Fodinibius roseus]
MKKKIQNSAFPGHPLLKNDTMQNRCFAKFLHFGVFNIFINSLYTAVLNRSGVGTDQNSWFFTPSVRDGMLFQS